MKKLSFLLALCPVFAFNVSCEQQKWEETKMFNQNPRGHAKPHDAAAGTAVSAPAEGEAAKAH